MSLSPDTWSSDLLGRLNGIGFTGTKLPEFAQAVGTGSVTHVVGKTGVTVDTGTIPGIGVGTGIGIIGFSSSLISSTVYGLCVSSFGQAGSKLMDLCDQVAATCVAQMALATLMSDDVPVYLGSGIITPGTIAVVGAAWGSLIQAQEPGFMGAQWPNFAMALGQGQAQVIQAMGTGNLVITGSPTAPPPVTGGGVGVVTIS